MKELMSYFQAVDPKVDFAKLEEAVIDFWNENDTFQRSVDQRPVEKSYVFYDGPPFATGLPHYGHIMTSIIKDVVPRFFTMKGWRVERRFGWDCHGVPVEFEMEKELGLNGRADIEEMGIANFNEACRGIVLRYTKEWETVVRRVGRWVDFVNDYKTMNPEYMESVWWVFKRLWDEGLIYQDYKVVHYSWRLSTPYSNFEATLDDAYRERQDPSVVVKFQLEDDDAKILAWTTTPWTLPSNMALAVNPELNYMRLSNGDGHTYILASDLVEAHFKEGDYTVLGEVKGDTLVGKQYQPLLPYFSDKATEGAFRVIPAEYVSAEDGTGIVHMAPAFGEEDFYAAKEHGIPMVNPVDDNGEFTDEVPDFVSQNVFDANKNIIRHLKEVGKLHSQKTITHNYPHDWRTDTPLIYRAIPSWYVKVTDFKDRILANNEKMNWYPHHVKDGAFGKWLENARDWAISRNRFWGAPIPVWRCDSCDEQKVLGSISELETLSGVSGINDLHSHFIDDITFSCEGCNGTMKRIPDVLDCWFESGSMPYAQVHYPFENKDWFNENFPADFIVEYIGQTRGWFYTLIVLSSALFDEPMAKNAIAHGILLGDDGRKMSKRLKNYPDVSKMLDQYGADAMRLYLMGHPVIDGNDSSVTEQGMSEMMRRFVIPVWSAFSFFTRYADIDGWRPEAGVRHQGNDLDRWIRSRTYDLTYHVGESLEAYNLRGAVNLLLDFVDDLNNWYIRRSRERFWKSEKDDDKLAAYETLHEVLVLLCKVAAPLTPFMMEAIYKNLTNEESLHLADWPTPDRSEIYLELNQKMATLRQIASLGLAARAKANARVRQPLAKVSVKTSQAMEDTDIDLLKDELNVKAVELLDDVSAYTEATAKPNGRLIGPMFGKDTSQIIRAVKSGDFETLADGSYKVAGNDAWVLTDEVVEVHYDAREGFACETSGGLVTVLDLQLTDELKQEGVAREIVRHIQTLRKDADYRLDDRIVVNVSSEDSSVLTALSAFEGYIQDEVLADALSTNQANGARDWDIQKSLSVEGVALEVALKRS
ncbi:MAG: isoleucine--tRNA ligase [Chloroflexota bacterium]